MDNENVIQRENRQHTHTLKAFQTYAKRLDEKYGKKAFKFFSEVDMRDLRKG